MSSEPESQHYIENREHYLSACTCEWNGKRCLAKVYYDGDKLKSIAAYMNQIYT